MEVAGKASLRSEMLLNQSLTLPCWVQPTTFIFIIIEVQLRVIKIIKISRSYKRSLPETFSAGVYLGHHLLQVLCLIKPMSHFVIFLLLKEWAYTSYFSFIFRVDLHLDGKEFFFVFSLFYLHSHFKDPLGEFRVFFAFAFLKRFDTVLWRKKVLCAG